MSRRPDFLREGTWARLNDLERQKVHEAVVGSEELAAKLEKAQQDVAMHRRLARKFADQARNLLDSIKDRPDSHGSPPSVVRRVEKLADELESTAGSGPPREVVPHGESPNASVREVAAYTPPSEVAAYTPPSEIPAGRTVSPLPGAAPIEPYAGPDDMDDEEREPTQVGATARVRSNVRREHTLSDADPSMLSYEGDLEIIDEVEEI